MKKIILLAFAICLCLTNVEAQNFLGRIGRAAKDAAENAVERNVRNKVEEEVDNAMNGKNDKQNSEQDENGQEETHKAIAGWTCPACGHEGNTGKFCSECGAKQPTENATAESWTCAKCGHKGNTGKFCDECGAKRGERNVESTYSKCDFVAGDEIIFEDNLNGEKIGEFPSKWDLVEGTAEVAKYDGKMVIAFESVPTKIKPLMKNPQNYLTDEFTIEYDFFAGDNSTFADGEYSRSQYVLHFYDAEENEVCEYEVHTADVTNCYWSYRTTSENTSYSDMDIAKLLKETDWNHFALSFNKRALKVYINGTRVTNIPNMKAPAYVILESRRWQDHFVDFVSNFRIAKGAVPLYDRMMTDGKFITYGITFDVGESVIKEESLPEINRIVALMNDNPTVKFEVQGHTDNTGNAAQNQALSEARAKAIVDKLVELGIASDRLSAVGKGQNNPIADNNTDEGRAKNRRVEFVKK
ncbi:MAG: OmpA family protein [Bacteroidales bacterium]|nr:OmpA family protein [Bacteroidales bacterium]